MNFRFSLTFCLIGLLYLSGISQVSISDQYLVLNAKANDPLFTTYAAAMERSRFFADKAYFMDYFSPERLITYSNQYSGEWAVLWKVNNMVIDKIREFARPPVVVASFPDMAILNYSPFPGLEVEEVFFVYSSGAAIIHLNIKNTGSREFQFNLYPLIHLPEDSLRVVKFDAQNNGYIFTHYESTIRLHSNLYANRGYPTHFRNLLSCDLPLDSYGTYKGCEVQDFYFAVKRLSKVHSYVLKLNEQTEGSTDCVA
jgi:hypothetical protein